MCLQDEVIADPADGDSGLVFRRGFDQFVSREGPLVVLRPTEVVTFAARMSCCDDKSYGPQIEPCDPSKAHPYRKFHKSRR